mgnify:FL=1
MERAAAAVWSRHVATGTTRKSSKEQPNTTLNWLPALRGAEEHRRKYPPRHVRHTAAMIVAVVAPLRSVDVITMLAHP